MKIKLMDNKALSLCWQKVNGFDRIIMADIETNSDINSDTSQIRRIWQF